MTRQHTLHPLTGSTATYGIQALNVLEQLKAKCTGNTVMEMMIRTAIKDNVPAYVIINTIKDDIAETDRATWTAILGIELVYKIMQS